MNEFHGAVGELVRQILNLRCARAPIVDRVWTRRLRAHVRVRTSEKAKEFVESSLHGMELRSEPQMPLPEQGGAISRALEIVRDRPLLETQAQVTTDRAETDVEFVAEPLLVSPGHEPRARGAAHRSGDVRIREANPASCERVDIGCRDIDPT